MSEIIEKVARALCEEDGHDPDALEPGSDPYMNNTECIDGYNAKGEACHFFWRHYDAAASATVKAGRDDFDRQMINWLEGIRDHTDNSAEYDLLGHLITSIEEGEHIDEPVAVDPNWTPPPPDADPPF